MPDIDSVKRALHCRAQDLMIDPPPCDQCDYSVHTETVYMCDFRRLCRDAAELIGNLDKQIRELEFAHAGAEELLRQKTILFDEAIKRLEKLKEQEAVEPKHNPLSPTDWFCGKCGMCISRFHDYCPSCGRAAKWNDSD